MMKKDREAAERNIGNGRMRSESRTGKHVEGDKVNDMACRVAEEKLEKEVEKRGRINGKRMNHL